jgi:hypothetical protein
MSRPPEFYACAGAIRGRAGCRIVQKKVAGQGLQQK